MTMTARTLWIGCAAALLSGGAVQAQEACTTYTIAPGDNLRRIARKAYGDPDLFRVIYEANIAVIGAKADLIAVGSRLVIPCDPNAPVEMGAAGPGGSAVVGDAMNPAADQTEVVTVLPAETSVENTEAEPPVTAAAAPAADAGAPVPQPAPPVRIVTGNGYAPFADKTLPGGGMFTQLVEMAIFRADPAITYNLTFISDWQAHIDALLPSQAYDLSFPWLKPDCEGTTILSPGDQARCDNFVFSAPYYEIVDGFFARSDSDLVDATSYAAFEGKRICRPEGFTTGVLDAVGLSVPVVELMRPIEAVDCFEALEAGKVDLVSIDVEVGDSTIARLGLSKRFAQNPHLFTLQSLHVIAHKSNPAAVAMIGVMDEGLIEMYESGEWYDIVSTALSQNAQLQQ
ncbi:transporter substrate-binding domain-containing protein [Tabrizicola sp. YIM 78059]|uniref:transporter substrate-binding domain-containing protein n=1 Tax=Tabrizicola sp. YIM 78059 TaxID=2529861 RepID=UPI0010A9DA59|nr:transporter substrate-binding domain-containing protein [Tabrizicola sp. YIM 78059]